MMIDQIRELQKQGAEFALELASGRVIQIYDPWMVATKKSRKFGSDESGTVAVLHSDGAFELIAPEQIVALTKGVHWLEQNRMKAKIARAKKIIGEEPA